MSYGNSALIFPGCISGGIQNFTEKGTLGRRTGTEEGEHKSLNIDGEKPHRGCISGRERAARSKKLF